MNLRDLCRCGHKRSSHGPSCKTCHGGCEAFTPAYLTFDVLPLGVQPVRDFVGGLLDGLTLVGCTHKLEREAAWCPFCFADGRMTDGFALPVKSLVFAPRELRLL